MCAGLGHCKFISDIASPRKNAAHFNHVDITFPMVDQACGCEAASGDPDYSCDCAMQGHCICSHDCKCNTDVCKEAVSQL